MDAVAATDCDLAQLSIRVYVTWEIKCRSRKCGWTTHVRETEVEFFGDRLPSKTPLRPGGPPLAPGRLQDGCTVVVRPPRRESGLGPFGTGTNFVFHECGLDDYDEGADQDAQ